MPILEVEGKRVEVDDSFLSLSPADQERQVEEIAGSIRGSTPAPEQTAQPESNLGAAIADSATELGAGAISGPQNLIDATPGVGTAYKAVEDALPEYLKPFTPRNVGQSLKDAVDYVRPSDASLDELSKRWTEGDYTGVAETILKGGLYTAIESVPEVALAVRNPGAAATAALGQITDRREQANGGKDATLGDIALAAPAAVAEAALDRFGGRLMAKGPVKGTVGGVATDAGGGAIQEAAGTVGTEEGLSPENVGKAAAESAIFGSVAGAGRGATEATTRAGLRAASRKLRGEASDAQVKDDLSKNQSQVLSEERVRQRVEREMADASTEDDVSGLDRESRTLKNLTTKLESEFGTTVDYLEATGVLTPDVRRELLDKSHSELSLAKRHNRFLTEGGLQRVRSQILRDAADPALADRFEEQLRDLNTASKNSLYKERRGPLARAGAAIGAVGGGIVGVKAGGVGAVGGAIAGKAAGENLGGKIDRWMGVGQPDAIRRAQSRAPALQRMGINPGAAGDGLNIVREQSAAIFGKMYNVDIDDKSLARVTVATQLKQQATAQRQQAQQLRQQQKEAAQAAAKAAAEEQALQKKAEAEEAALVKRAQMGTMQFMRGQAQRDNAQAQLTADDGPKMLPLGQIQAAQKGTLGLTDTPQSVPLRQIQQAQAALRKQREQAEAAAQKLDAEAAALEAQIAQNDQQRQQLGGALDELGPRTDGWAMEHVEKHFEQYGETVPITEADFMEALAKAVKMGRLSQEEAQFAFKVPGARLGKKGDGLMLLVNNEASLSAIRRAGIEPTPDNVIKLRQRQIDVKAARQGRQAAVRKQAAQDTAAEIRAARKATKAAQEPEQSRVKVKAPRAPRPKRKPLAGTTGAVAARSPDQEMEVVSRSAAYRSEERANDTKLARAVERAPTAALAEAAQEIRESNDPAAKKARYERVKAEAETKAQLDWVGRYLHPLIFFGRGMGEERKAYEIENGSLVDPELIETRTRQAPAAVAAE